MAYHEEDKAARLLANYFRWAGDSPIRGCGQLWDPEKIDARDLRKEWRSSYAIEAMGQEAQLTKDALATMDGPLRFALITFHSSSLTFEMQARDKVRVSKSTYHHRLVRAHLDFDAAYERQQQLARDRTAAYLRILNASA